MVRVIVSSNTNRKTEIVNESKTSERCWTTLR